MKPFKIFHIVNAAVKATAIKYIQDMPIEGQRIECKEQGRTLDQNAAMWPILNAFSEQVQWPVNGVMVYMSSENWKDVLTAAFSGETAQIAQGLNGGCVFLGMRTSKMGKKEFSEFLEFIHMVAADKGVKL